MKKFYIFIPLLILHNCLFSQIISSVDPNEADQGDELEVTISGDDTQWMQGTNVLFFKQGSSTIYPSPQTVVSNTEIKGYFYFNAGHQTGLYEVRVENWSNGDVVALEDGFTLNEGTEGVLSSIEPDSAHQAESLTVTVTGENTNFLQGSTVLKFSNNQTTIYPQSQTIINDTVLEADFYFNIGHPADVYDVMVTSYGGYLVLENVFTLLPVINVPGLISINPDTAEQEETVTITITGENTHFDDQGVTNLVYFTNNNSFNYAFNVTATSSTTLEADFEFTYYNQPGEYDIFLSNELDGTMSLANIFMLEEGPNAPGITMVEPDTAMQTEEVWITITGENVDFSQGSPTLYLHQQNGSLIYPDDQNVLNDTVIEADFFFNPDQNVGYYNVIVSDMPVFLENGFYLMEPDNYPGTPVNDPNIGTQNEPLFVTITVEYAHFDHPDLETAVSLVKRNDDIIADNVIVIDSNVIEAEFMISDDHEPGLYDLKLFNMLDGTLWVENAFTLQGDTNSVKLVEVNPDHAKQGETLWITITGQNTSFNTGSATILLKQGSSTLIVPFNENVISDTEIEGDFNFNPNDPLGDYDVIVYDLGGAWTVEQEAGFTLNLDVSIDEIEDIRIAKVYPNPASDFVFIERGRRNNKGITIDILTLAGDIINISKLTSTESTKKIDVSNYESGVYLLRLRSEEDVKIQKIIIR